MLDLSNTNNIYVYNQEVDMRMGINKIQTILTLSFSPIEILDSMFIFVSRNRKVIKIYYENEYGTWLLINKVKYFKFQVDTLKSGAQITKKDLEYLLKGVVLKSERLKQISI